MARTVTLFQFSRENYGSVGAACNLGITEDLPWLLLCCRDRLHFVTSKTVNILVKDILKIKYFLLYSFLFFFCSAAKPCCLSENRLREKYFKPLSNLKYGDSFPKIVSYLENTEKAVCNPALTKEVCGILCHEHLA